jgi:hypothetical protein
MLPVVMNYRITPTSVTLLALVAVLPSLTLADNANVGTWKLDPAKSEYSDGAAPKSATLTIAEQGDGVKATCELVKPDGTNISYGYTASYDGKDYPLTGSGTSWQQAVSGADTVILRRENSKTFGTLFKKSGFIVVTVRSVVSRDGKVLTTTAVGIDAKGQQTKNVGVWDKQ